MSTYSPSLRIELIATGDQAGTWGNTTNTNLGTLIESGICGYTSVSVTTANQALTALNGAADQSRNMVLALTTTTTAAFNVYAPPAEKVYIIFNASAYTATIYNSTVIGNTTAAGVGVSIPAGKTMTVWSDGTNFSVQNDHLSSLTLGTDLAIADGGTGASTAAGARTNLGVTATGQDTTYAFRANNLSDLASASSARTNLGLGSMATQNSNSVTITGGAVSGTALTLVNNFSPSPTAAGRLEWSTSATTIIAGDGTFSVVMATTGTPQTFINKTLSTGSTWEGNPVGVLWGGTGASTAAGARSNLGVTATGQDTTYLFRANNLSDLTNATTARSNLGLGSMATQNANSVSISGGTVNNVSMSSPTITGGLISGLAAPIALASGGTGATDAAGARTNLGLGTMATQNANAVSISGGSISGTTQPFGTNNTLMATTAFVQAAFQALHPVGSIYINATDSTNPATLFGFGTWVAFGAGRVPVGFDSGNALFNSPEETGGSYDATLVAHDHGGTNNGNATHTHSFSGTTASSGSHTHTLNINANLLSSDCCSYRFPQPNGSPNSTQMDAISTAGAHTHTYSGITTIVDATHSHAIPTAGTSATNANIQPYITVYMWKRTA